MLMSTCCTFLEMSMLKGRHQLLHFSTGWCLKVQRSTSKAALFYSFTIQNALVNVDLYKSAAIDTVDAVDVQKSVAFYHAPNNDEKETSKLVLS